MDDDEDVVIEEIPVFLSRNLENNLYLFQYPTKTNVSNLDGSVVVNCCVKPLNNDVKVDFALNTESKNYDRFKGEQFALASDGKVQAKGERPTFKHGIMDKQSYTSTKSVDNNNKYVIGIYQDKEIHLSTLASILQLRPNFSYFDKEDKRAKAEEKAANDEEEDEELTQVTVKFSRTDSERLKKAKEKTYDHFIKKSAEEPWCETYWHSRNSPTAELEKQKLFATNQQTSHALALDNQQYMNKLMPVEKIDRSIEAMLPSKVISKAKLKLMSLNDQLKVILKDAKMLAFNDIMALLEECDAGGAPEKVLRNLPLVGVLIRGNWVVQSEVLYPAETLSNSNGVTSELMIRGRDYVLYKFSKEEFQCRGKVITSTQLPPDEALEILQSVARLNSEKKWELILSPDTNFENRCPDLVQRQEMVWRALEQTFTEMDLGEKSEKRVRKRSVREPK